MNAPDLQRPRRRPMVLADLGAVLALEAQAYSHPWSQGNFIDSLAAGHLAEVLVGDSLIAYFVAMEGVDELHLLNLTVAPAWQGRGHGSALLDEVLAHARARHLGTVWLEVRASNLRARALYARRGFDETGLRRGYYPATRGREDAVVMRRLLAPAAAMQAASAASAASVGGPMPWSERQRAMLREIGLRVWQAAGGGAAVSHSHVGGVSAGNAAAEPAAPSHGAARHGAPRQPAGTVTSAASVATLDAAALQQPPPGAAAVAGLDWPALREAVASCRACRLCDSRKQTVFGVGHAQAHWMVVGEAPGAQEDDEGEPFVGAAGQLLDAMLHALALSRSAEGDPARRVFIANTLKCRPPGNRNPQPDEMQRCEPFLVRQIQLVRPRIILAMGRFAVQALLRTNEPVGRLRGRAHRYQGVPLVVTYHPAYLLRNLPDKARAWEDLCLAAQLMDEIGAAPQAVARESQ